MRLLPAVLPLAAALLLAGCASNPESRIAEKRAIFDQFPAAVQQKIRAGEVDVGFTPEMVRLALGEPARQFTRQSNGGDSEVWVYVDNGPRFSIGVGVGGSMGRHSSAGVGLSTSTGGYDPEEKTRVEFRGGKVVAVEAVKNK